MAHASEGSDSLDSFALGSGAVELPSRAERAHPRGRPLRAQSSKAAAMEGGGH